MTQERFLQIIQTPDLLAGISYEEIKTLALAYPAAHNLRILLALKAQQTDHPEFKKQLATAAAYSLDRNKLFLLVEPAPLIPQRALAQEEILELKPIEDIKKELESKIPREKTATMKEKAKSAALEAPVGDAGKTEPTGVITSERVPPPSMPPAAPVALSAPNFPGEARWISLSVLPPLQQVSPDRESAAGVYIRVQSEMTAEPPDPIDDQADEKNEPEQPDSPAQEESGGISAQELAERSVQLREVVASETFARLLARQGYIEKAVVMYEKLRLLFPEKSDYFAAEIKKLKK